MRVELSVLAAPLDKHEFTRVDRAVKLATERILTRGADDVFKPPIFSQSIESKILAQRPDEFRKEARHQAIDFLKIADLARNGIGPVRRSLVAKDQSSFRQVAWLDPFDSVKYLSATYLLFEKIEAARLPKNYDAVHSHRMSDNNTEIFDTAFGYDSFRSRSSALSKDRIGKWKVVTDIANFYDRIGIHPLENHLLNIGCDRKYVTLIREILLFWAGDRRSFGVPVGSDASRILSEAVLLNVDSALTEAGTLFVRYVDDFRIFVETRADALKVIEFLTTLLADEGLSLNSRKTDVFKIVDAEEIAQFANKFAGGEHEKIDLEEKIEVKTAIRISGHSSISRFYREPGKDALRKIKQLPKTNVIDNLVNAAETDVEQHIKLAVKYFVYADQNVDILKTLIDKKITSIFYIADALEKEESQFDSAKCDEIRETIFNILDWARCAYPLQVPVIRIAGHPSFKEPRYVCDIIDNHLQKDNILFYREAISLGASCLDRARLRKLAIEVFGTVPDFVQRTIYYAVKNHNALSDEEKRPLLKNMKQEAGDWFINST